MHLGFNVYFCQSIRVTKSKVPALHSCRVVHSCCSAFLKTKTRQKTLILHISSADGFEFVTVKSEVARRNKELSKGRHRRLEGRESLVRI